MILVPTLVLRTWDAPHIVVASLAAAADTQSSLEAVGSWGLTVQSKDLWGHRRQICVATRRRWAAAHRAWVKTDWMFAPWLRGCLVRLIGSGWAGLLRSRAGCTLGTILNALTEAGFRNLSLALRKTRSWRACNPGQRGTAQQMLDLQNCLQTDVRYSARRVSSNLTADTPVVVWRPLAAEVGLREDATRGWR
jgi:hypothetical protein